MKLKLKLKQIKLPKTVKYIYQKIQYVGSTYQIVKSFLIEKTEQDYISWKLKDDKPLLTIGIEKLFNGLTRYVLIGLFLAYASKNFLSTTMSIGYVLSYATAYWLLKDLLKTITKQS